MPIRIELQFDTVAEAKPYLEALAAAKQVASAISTNDAAELGTLQRRLTVAEAAIQAGQVVVAGGEPLLIPGKTLVEDAVPEGADAEPTGTTRRPRRTKAEMDAARAAEAAQAALTAPQDTKAAEPTVEQPATAVVEAVAPVAPVAQAVVEPEAPGVAAETAQPETDPSKIVPKNAEEAETYRNTYARPAMTLIVKAAGQDVARQFVVDQGFPKLGEIPGADLPAFTAAALAYVAGGCEGKAK